MWVHKRRRNVRPEILQVRSSNIDGFFPNRNVLGLYFSVDTLLILLFFVLHPKFSNQPPFPSLFVSQSFSALVCFTGPKVVLSYTLPLKVPVSLRLCNNHVRPRHMSVGEWLAGPRTRDLPRSPNIDDHTLTIHYRGRESRTSIRVLYFVFRPTFVVAFSYCLHLLPCALSRPWLKMSSLPTPLLNRTVLSSF